MPNPLISAILETLNAEVLRDLALARQIEHPGESGRARERVISRFFRRLLPEGVGIDTGFVIDAVGGKSRQIDLVMFRGDYHPIFEIGGVRHFLVEGVLAVIQNRARIDSRDDLREALENVASVKLLDRTNARQNYRLVGTDRGPAINPDFFNDQVFGAIVTEQSLALDTLEAELLAFLRATPRRGWPNMYADVTGIEGFYAIPTQTGLSSSARTPEAVNLCVVDRRAENGHPLITLGSELVNFVRVASLVDFNTKDYLTLLAGAQRSTPI